MVEMMVIRYAGFWRRFVAHWIDGVVIQVLTVLVGILTFSALGLSNEEIEGWRGQVFSVGLYVCLAFPYYTIGHYYWGATLGKRLLGVRVVDSESGQAISATQSILRTVGYFISYLSFMLGFLVAAFDVKKRSLQDRLASTVCIRV